MPEYQFCADLRVRGAVTQPDEATARAAAEVLLKAWAAGQSGRVTVERVVVLAGPAGEPAVREGA